MRDVHHERAQKVWQGIESGKYGECFTTDYVFNEVVGVTFRKFGKERSSMLGEHILRSILILNIDGHLLASAWDLFRNTLLQLNLVDCSNIAAMSLAKTITIATFDVEFTKVKGIEIIS